MLHQLVLPIASVGAGAAGAILLQLGYTETNPHVRALWEIHCGGALIGVGCALLFVRTTAGRLVAAFLVGVIGALAFTVSTYQLAAAAYIVCIGIWWLTRTFAITRDAYPRLGRHSQHHRASIQPPPSPAVPGPWQSSTPAQTTSAATPAPDHGPNHPENPATAPASHPAGGSWPQPPDHPHDGLL